MSEVADDVLHRVHAIEERMDKIEDKLIKQGEADVEMKSDMKAMRNEFNGLKSDVLMTVKDHTDKTWNLINRSWKIIMVLIAIIVLFSGVKMGPEIIKALLG
jgi:hypothetical protein